MTGLSAEAESGESGGAGQSSLASSIGTPSGTSADVETHWITLEPMPTASEASAWLLPPQSPPQAVPLRCWSARPRTAPPRAGVLVLPEVFGINAWVRSITQRLAAEGYLALAMPLFARTAPDLELGYQPEDLREGRLHKEQTSAAGLLIDAATACSWLEGQLGRRGGLGCVGFCFGGHAALITALLPSIAACVDCYGAGVATGRPGGGPPSLDLVPRIPGRLLCLCGSEDPLIPPADVDAIRAALAGANHSPPHRLLELQAGHGFLCDMRADHRPAAAAIGWSALLEFYRETLG